MLDTLSVTTVSVTLALMISLVALGLVLWLRFERSSREDEISEADREHFARQDSKRNAGLAILFILAQGIAISPRVEIRGLDGRPNPVFLILWLAIALLILALLILAFLDMIATRMYARRHRAAIHRERLELLRDLEALDRGTNANRDAASSDPETSEG